MHDWEFHVRVKDFSTQNLQRVQAASCIVTLLTIHNVHFCQLIFFWNFTMWPYHKGEKNSPHRFYSCLSWSYKNRNASLHLTMDLFSCETDWNFANVITPIEHYPSYYMATWQLLKEASIKYWWGIAVKLIQHSISWLIKVSVSLLERLQKICLKSSVWLQSLFHSFEKRSLSENDLHQILMWSVMKTRIKFMDPPGSFSLFESHCFSFQLSFSVILYALFISSMLTDSVSLAIWLFPSFGHWLYVSKGHEGLFLPANRKR